MTPNKNVRGVVSHAKGKEEGREEESRKEDGEEKEEIGCVDSFNVAVHGHTWFLELGVTDGEGKGRGVQAC